MDELILFLTKHHIDISLYGVGQAKTVEQLFKEIKEGETYLQLIDDRLHRCIEIVNIILYDDLSDRYLREKEQQFHPINGRNEYFRSRNSFIAEKMKGGENVNDAINRGLKEEINIDGKFGYSLTTVVEFDFSVSYPGLMTKYVVNNVVIKINVKDYPTINHDSFKITEYLDEKPRLTTTWEWQPLRSFYDQITPSIRYAISNQIRKYST